MSLKITEHPDGYIAVTGPAVAAALDPDEQRELLEALARVHGFSLVDREQRRQLAELVGEVRGLEGQAWASMADCVIAYEGPAKALAETVANALDMLPEIPAGG